MERNSIQQQGERSMPTKYNVLCVCFEEEVIDVVWELLTSLQSIVIVLVSEWDSKWKLGVKGKYKMFQKDDSTQLSQTISNMYKNEEEGAEVTVHHWCQRKSI